MSTTSFTVSVRPELFRWARETSGYSADQLAKAAGVSPGVWVAWESGQARPTFRQLEKVAKKCRRPVALFYLPQPPAEDVAPEDFRRLPGRRPTEFAPETILAFRRARRLQHVATEVLDLGQPGADRRLPRFHTGDDPEAAGAAIRELMGVSVEAQRSWFGEIDAYRQWRLAAERAGVLVFQFRMPLDNARGFSLWDDRLPVVVTNSADSPAARCFTLFHEMTHLALRTPGVCLVEPAASIEPDGQAAQVERFCDTTAAAVLLPLADNTVSDALETAANAETLPQAIIGEASRFKVSREAMLWRMVDAGRLPREVARRVHSGWTAERAQAAPSERKGGGPRLPVRRLAERGLSFSSAVLEALDEGRITYPDASEFLDLSTTQLDRFREDLSRGLQRAVSDE